MLSAPTSRSSFSSLVGYLKRRCRADVTGAVLIIVACFFCRVGHAQAEYFEIDSYSVVIEVTENAELHVEETIDVRFLSPRHGIHRTIPYAYDADTLTGSYTTNLYDIEVPGETWTLGKRNSSIDIQIGDPNRYVSGRHRYTIRYKVFGAIQFQSEFSELYWNAIGLEWNVPIHRAFIEVIPPSGTTLTPADYFAYTGSFGSTERNARVSWNNQSLTVATTRSLNPREGVTIGMKFPEGALRNGDVVLRAWLLFVNYGVVVIPIGTFILLYFVWRTYGRDEALTQMVFYQPPKEINSAEAGVLENDVADNRDLVSLIVAWAAQGFLDMREIELEGFFGGKDLELQRREGLPEDARGYERLIFDRLFESGDKVLVSSLRNSFHSTMKEARSALNVEIDRLGLYEPASRLLGKAMGGLAIVVFFLHFWLVRYNVSSSAITIPSVFLTAGILAIFASIMPKKSSKGRRLYQQVAGFRDFMKRVEAPQLARLLEEDPLYFNKTIAFAVVFGMAAPWTERFQGILAAPPEWYSTTAGRPFTSVGNLGGALESNLQTMTSAFSASSSGSEEFSGGGSGGGGGGSW